MVESSRIRSNPAPTEVPTWGYHATHGARVFELLPGGKLPAGWADVPHTGQHPHEAELAHAPASAIEEHHLAARSRKIAGRGRKRR